MTVFWARVEAAIRDRRELVHALLGWLEAVRREDGVAGAHVSEDLEAPGVYCLSSTWRRREDLEGHLSGADFGVLLGALDVLGQRTHLEVTVAAEGAEDTASLVRRLRGRAPSWDRGHGAFAGERGPEPRTGELPQTPSED